MRVACRALPPPSSSSSTFWFISASSTFWLAQALSSRSCNNGHSRLDARDNTLASIGKACVLRLLLRTIPRHAPQNKVNSQNANPRFFGKHESFSFQQCFGLRKPTHKDDERD